jgi:Nif-specific regulatory protein
LTAIACIASIAIENVQQIESLKAENKRLNQEISLNHNMIGDSPVMHEVYRMIGKVAPTDSTVLIRGESGTGKELAAYAIHANSPRADKPFLAINCAALTETLLESELFGHEKGSFTGAIAQKKGKLERANGGTFFLDEIGEINPTLQVKLLRVLQNRIVERVGGSHPIKVDVRLIAATNRNLEEAIRQGSFREDLYYRLNVVEMVIPPLRERREDIPLLAQYFALKHGQRCKRHVVGISPEVRDRLISYDWRGNVRELENVIERAIVLGSTELIVLEDLPQAIFKRELSESDGIYSFKKAVEEKKKYLVLDAVEKANGSYTEAARLLDMHPNNLHRLIRTLKLKPTLRA